jgi:murein DD-endopeptidase MepM/ murein hydrolase activator NlpD
MGTFVYNPGVQVFIQTLKHGIVDVSDDLVSGTLDRVVDNPSTFQFTLQNTARKFDSPAPIFTPNDRVIVNMKRTKWVRVFTGYLDEVPVFSVWPRDVTLKASCSLKKIKYWFWDPKVQQTYILLNDALIKAKESTDPDGGIKGLAIAVLDQVAGWPKDRIHIGAIPQDWFDAINPYIKEIIAEVAKANDLTQQYMNSVGASSSVGGAGSGVTSGSITMQDIVNAAAKAGFPSSELATAGAVAQAESSGVVDIRNSIGASGLWQILESAHPEFSAQWKDGSWKDPVVNARMALSVWQASGSWRPWEAYTNGRYQQYLGDARAAAGKANPNAPISTAGKSAGASAPTGPSAVLPGPGDRAGQGGWKNPLPGGNNSHNYGQDRGSHIHEGDDISAPLNTQIFAAGDGTVLFAGLTDPGGYGSLISIQHAGYVSQYGHVQSWKVNAGDHVTAGQLIGGVGARGDSTGAHLHFEIRIGNGTVGQPYYGKTVNPENFMLSHGVQLGDGSLPGTTDDSSAAGGAGGAAADPFFHYEALIDTDAVGNNPIDKLFQGAGTNFNIAPPSDTSGQLYWGIRALMNDTPLLPYVKQLLNSSMRQMSSGPNGDIIAWFPDYFGQWGTAATLVISDIELRDFSVKWNDELLITHMFATAALTSSINPTDGTLTAAIMDNDFFTAGIASIEIPTLVAALYGIDPKKFDHAEWLAFMLKRFGARSQSLHPQGALGKRGEFFIALYEFMKAWANQYLADVPVTFMPEAWPGMILKLPQYDFKAYIQGVTHSFKFGPGGSFETNITITAPSKLGKSNRILFGLPVVPEVDINNTNDLGSETLNDLNIKNINSEAHD